MVGLLLPKRLEPQWYSETNNKLVNVGGVCFDSAYIYSSGAT